MAGQGAVATLGLLAASRGSMPLTASVALAGRSRSTAAPGEGGQRAQCPIGGQVVP